MVKIKLKYYWPPDWLTDWLTDRPTDRPTDDRPTDWPTDWPTDRPTDWLTHWLTTDWLNDWMTDRLTHGLTDSQTHWLTDSLTHWLTHWLTDSLNDWLADSLTHSLTHSLPDQNRSSASSRQKFTQKEVKNNYQFENYLTLITKPAHRISLTRLRLGCHALRIQTGKYENWGALIPVEERIWSMYRCKLRPGLNVAFYMRRIKY